MKKKIFITGLLILTVTISGFSQYAATPRPFMSREIFKDFLKLHFDYPENDIKNGRQGKFVLRFITNKQGKVIQKNIVKSVSPQADSIASDIFDKILWLPATINGLPVKGQGSFSLKFNIRKFEKLAKKRGYRHIAPPLLPVDNSYRIYKPKETDVPAKPVLKPYKSLDELIYSELTYPGEALKKGISGVVKISFIIETNGLPSNIHVIDYVGAGCTEEAVKTIENIRWIPAMKNGKAVRSLKILSVTFSLEQHHIKYIPKQSERGSMN